MPSALILERTQNRRDRIMQYEPRRRKVREGIGFMTNAIAIACSLAIGKRISED
ncbi:MAG: hypothetical protein RMY33_009745 [Nostoc sp. DedQUE03]|nr:hypothetical protein [Nostoc sp. DedQUE02]